jgi:hypothetical protein
MLKVTVWGVPLVRVTVTVEVMMPLPAVIEPLAGLTETAKSNGWRVTVRVYVAVLVRPPPVPVIVIV